MWGGEFSQCGKETKCWLRAQGVWSAIPCPCLWICSRGFRWHLPILTPVPILSQWPWSQESHLHQSSFKIYNIGCLKPRLRCDLQVTDVIWVLTFLTLSKIQPTNELFQDLGIPDSTPGPHRFIQQQDQHARQEPGPGVGPESPQVTTASQAQSSPHYSEWKQSLGASKLKPWKTDLGLNDLFVAYMDYMCL